MAALAEPIATALIVGRVFACATIAALETGEEEVEDVTADPTTPANICAAAISSIFRLPHAAGLGSGNFPSWTMSSWVGATMEMVDALVAVVVVVGMEVVSVAAAAVVATLAMAPLLVVEGMLGIEGTAGTVTYPNP